MKQSMEKKWIPGPTSGKQVAPVLPKSGNGTSSGHSGGSELRTKNGEGVRGRDQHSSGSRYKERRDRKKEEKKVKWNQLVNFNAVPRKRESHTLNIGPKRVNHHRKPPVDKQLCLQSRCQFIVREEFRKECEGHMLTPDAHLDWNHIEEVCYPAEEETLSCPICLGSCRAAKITRCGHVFCWACILHYLALSDQPSRKCPICYDAIRKDELKSIKCRAVKTPKVGEEMEFQLMRRKRGSGITVPVETYDSTFKDTVAMLDGASVHAHILLASSAQVIGKVVGREQLELEEQLKEEEHEPEAVFVQEALKLLEERQHALENVRLTILLSLGLKLAEVEALDTLLRVAEKEMLLSTSPASSEENVPGRPREVFYFYQDGQKVYLQAVNVHMLEAQYGALERCPPRVKGQVVEIEEQTMTEDLRWRTRYLQHLPLHASFRTVEINLLPPIVSPRVIQGFYDWLEKRRRDRKRKEKKEERAEKRNRPRQDSEYQEDPTSFPPVLSQLDQPNIPTEDPALPEPLAEAKAEEQIEDISPVDMKPTSFAQILREGKKQEGKDLEVKEGHAGERDGQQIRAGSSVDDDEGGGDGYLASPPSFGDFFSQAFHQLSLQGEEGQEPEEVLLQQQDKKKKKKKGRLLFRTTLVRSDHP
ncbi:unnamed protein product [Darwinula stevensoni]|uniref:E3 ubiquitin-protein ligase RNF10 n=1 Tax=Darwinula stevensoni TaxID=69355 RepID=A0A7R8XE76_9CRUS|nr:unnamed protein product [Darwinula stevensoni]CAG0895539.1 unnamed protein product [Darwinula stevensoni]